MKQTVQKLFGVLGRPFGTGGKLEKLHPLYEAVETVVLWPDRVTAVSPQVRDHLDLKRFMSFVILALIPPAVYGIYNTGYQSRLASGLSPDTAGALWTGLLIFLPMLIVSYGAGLFWEVLFAAVRKHPVSEGFLVTGLLFPLTLPPTTPLWMVAAGISFGVVIGKEVFGGTGRNILNPALTARAFLFFAYPAQMSGEVWVRIIGEPGPAADAVTGATPLALAPTLAAGARLEPALREAGYSFSTLLWGGYPGSIGATSALMCLIGGIFLVLTGIANFRTIVGGIAGVLGTGYLICFFADPSASPWYSLNPFYHLVMGGFAFGLVYMATDPVTAPGMERVKYLYGFLIGALTVLIRVYNPAFPEGVMLAILFMNIFAPLLDQLEISIRN
ncbi:MAG: NADH:ubiquinone reductase (Na(+)-transporting) subunit B, partial [Thermodesulfobacteriota bacterium]